MNISEIHVDDFGAWHELTLGQLGGGVTVFYGPNEAGKTTLLNLVRTIFYGFSQDRCSRYLPPSVGEQAGGRLVVSSPSGQFELQRSAPSSFRGGAGNLRITSPDGSTHANELLITMLAGVDETIFNNVFAVGLTQMQQLATLSDTEAAKQLYGLATGADRVSLYDVTSSLAAQRDDLLAVNDDSRTRELGVVDKLLQEKRQLHKELKALRRDEGHLTTVRQEHRQLISKIKAQEAAKEQLDAKGSWPEQSSTIRGHWDRCLKINEQLTNIGAVIDLPKHVVARVAKISAQVQQRRTEWEKLRDERKRIKQQASLLRGCDGLYRHAAEIEALNRQRDRIVGLERAVKLNKATVDDLEFELQAELEELGLQTGTSAKQFPQLSDNVIEALRAPAREARQLRSTVETLKQGAADRRKQAQSIQGKLEAAAVRFGHQDIGKLVHQSLSLVDRLERRIQLDQHYERLVRKLNDIEEEAGYWQQRTMLPWAGVLVVCAVFSAGAMLLLTGTMSSWLSLADASRFPMMLIGGSLTVVSLVMKGAFESSAQQRAAQCQQQIELLHEDQRSVREEAEDLDRTLPAGGGNLDQRLIDAQEKVAELDQIIPLQRQFDELTREADAAEHQAKLAVRQLKDARRVWRASLRTVGLPDSLTPTQIGQLSGRLGDVTRLRSAMEDARREMHDRQQELDTIQARVDQLLLAGEIHDELDGLDAQLGRLRAALEEHSRSGRQREEQRGRWKELGDKQKRVAAAAESLIRARRQLLEKLGITGAKDYRDTRRRNRLAVKFRAERRQRLEQIAELTGEGFSIAKLEKMLDKRSRTLLDRLEQLDGNWQTIGDDLKAGYERAGQLKQKLDGQLEDRRRERKELEIQVVDQRLHQAAHQWRLNGLISAVLESVKEDYETKRQPVALAEASRYLERLTEARYRRIWTPMGQSALCVDDHEGNALTVEKLSRGTRELVFLALRLALVGSYSRRGANMPIVLDDVFVNFDDQRATAAANVLYEIASAGQQMLVFTCHERIRDIFTRLGADVRTLPRRSTEPQPAPVVAAEPTEPPEPTEPDLQEPDSTAEAEVTRTPDAVTENPNATPERRVRPFEPTWRDRWLELQPDLANDKEP